jgi:predicted Zn-dependent protease
MARPIVARRPPAVVWLVAALAGCAINPVSGRRELALVSASQEREIGREQAKHVEAEMGLVDDPQLTAYVREVGARIAAQSPLPGDYTFQIVDLPEPNAFSLPGGYVYVSRGLLALMSSEDELAGVVGHEVGHIAARHAVQRVSRAVPIAIVSGVGAAVTGIVSPTLGSVVGGAGLAANRAILAPYGREQEREADRVGAELEARAGWDPAGLAAALRTLARAEALQQQGGSPRSSFFATHPALPERVENVTALAAGIVRGSGTRIAATARAFVERLDGLVVGARADEGVLDGATFVHPVLGVAVTFPEGWKTENARDGVTASDPYGDAVIVLDVAGQGDDPARVLAEVDAQAGTDLARRAEHLRIDGRPAVRVIADAQGADGPLVLDLTCVAHGGAIFRILGAARPSAAARTAPAFQAAARSFRTPTAAERGRIRETRLRLVSARGGETVAALAARARSA